MAGEWRETTLGDFVALQRGHDLTESERTPGGVPVMGSAGQNGFHDTALAPGPGVVIGRSGASFGRVHYCAEDYWPHNTALYVTDFKRNVPRFAFYFLGAIDFTCYNSGSAQPSLNRNYICAIPVSFPEPGEQRAIAHILGTLDDKIELNRRMNETLEAMARALFKSWFVDFDPVRAKLEGRQPAGMDKATAALFPDAFDETAVGLVPTAWTTTTIGEETDFLAGFAFRSEFFSETPPGTRLARGDNVKEGFFYWGDKSRFWRELTPDLQRYLLRSGDTLIGMDGSKVGKNWTRVRESDLPCLLVQRVTRLRAKGSVGENFIRSLVSDDRFRSYVDGVKTGTSIPHISGGQIQAYDFIRPPGDDNRIFEDFEQVVSPLTRHADKNHEQTSTLAALRDALLPKLLSGEIRVGDAERIIEEAT